MGKDIKTHSMINLSNKPSIQWRRNEFSGGTQQNDVLNKINNGGAQYAYYSTIHVQYLDFSTCTVKYYVYIVNTNFKVELSHLMCLDVDTDPP